MKNKFLVGITTLVLSALLFTSCSKMPQVELDAANVAVEEVKAAKAELYVNQSYVILQDSLKAALTEIEAQGSKFLKNYAVAKTNLIGVAQYAATVKQEVDTRKAEIKVEIQNTIAEVNALIEVNKQLVLDAPKGKEGASALLAIKDEITAIEAVVAETNALLETGELLATLDKIKAAKEKATAINTELTEVIAKYKSNVKGRK